MTILIFISYYLFLIVAVAVWHNTVENRWHQREDARWIGAILYVITPPIYFAAMNYHAILIQSIQVGGFLLSVFMIKMLDYRREDRCRRLREKIINELEETQIEAYFKS